MRLTGPKVARQLQAHGIPVQRVTRKQNTGNFYAEFFTPDGVGGQDGGYYASLIADNLPNVSIIDTYTTYAEWRPGREVIDATVTFAITITDNPPADPATRTADEKPCRALGFPAPRAIIVYGT